jgi:CRISPR type III-A-associated protein Csm2
MDDEVQTEAQTGAAEPAPAAEPVKPEPAKPEQSRPEAKTQERPREERPRDDRSKEDRPRRDDRPPRSGPGGPPGGGDRGRSDRPGGGGNRDARGPDRRDDRREGPRPGGGRPFEGPPEIEIEKLIADSLYLDNQAHAVVARMRDMDSGTKSQLRRLYNAVRRAVRAPENERQHHFVMLRARLAYTIARHSLRSLDALERLLLQVTRKNDARGYERFKDLFEAIVAYNE